ncbi:hypothetical protein MUK42_34566 [Musa troglodytarum]|uniref:RRM domain-containing protein n=1 Tax=Musa troglodytarum TaxID=320322 RepID=A0A9E7HWN3_9LILI|nr:hypothetical protein MUK42_34566 [Musa troglodytarum]
MAFHHPGPGSASGSASSSSSGFHFPNSLFGDTTYTKVFVGGLAWETKSETLRRHFEQFVRPRSGLYLGGMSVQRGPYVGSPAHQQSVPFSYQEGLPYAAYSYNLYGPEYVYPQNAYNPYTGQPYVQVYGFPGAINTAIYPFDQFGQPIPPGYTALHGYTLPTQPIMQLSGPNVNGMASAPRPVIQAPYPADTLRLQQDQEQQYCHVNGLHSCLAIYHLCILEHQRFFSY